MKRLFCLLITLFLMQGMFSSCSPEEKPDYTTEFIKSISTSNESKKLSAIEKVKGGYVFYDSKGLFITEKIGAAPIVSVKKSGIEDVFLCSDYILFSTVKRKKASEINNTKIDSTTTIYVFSLKNNYSFKLKTIVKSDLSMVGTYNGHVYLCGHINNTKSYKCLSYDMKTKKLKTIANSIRDCVLFGKYLLFHNYYGDERNHPLIRKNLDTGYEEVLFKSAKICCNNFSEKSDLNFLSYECVYDESYSGNQKEIDHFVYSFKRDFSSTRSPKLFDGFQDLEAVYNDNSSALVRIRYAEKTADYQDGLYKVDLKTGKSVFLCKIKDYSYYFKGKNKDEIMIYSDGEFYQLSGNEFTQVTPKASWKPVLRRFAVIDGKIITIEDGVLKKYGFKKINKVNISESLATPTVSATEEYTSNPKNSDSDDDIVVMLDPGHDDDESPRNHPQLGVNEQDLNLKIAKACYNRLSKYEGIKAYMTRKDGHCPNADGQFSGEYDCIEKRAFLAEEKNADFFVSMHCNATTGELGAEANGITVYITNYKEYQSECEKLGNYIVEHVTKTVDLNSMGVRLSDLDESKGYYDDGSVKDKYYLLSYNIDNHRSAVIIEHAFMDNIHDNAILRDDNQLKRIGEADADAIAEYYNLQMK